MKLTKIILGILLFISSFSIAQSTKNKDWSLLAKENPDNAYLQFQAGIKTFFSLTENEYALEYFRKALLKVSTNEYHTTEAMGYAPIDVYYFMAECFRRMEQPDSVMNYLLKYQNQAISPAYPIALAMTKAYNASLQYRRKPNFETKDFPFNKKYNHTNNPVISVNGEKLFFTTEKIQDSKEIEQTGHANRDIIFCQKVNGKWAKDTAFLYNTTQDEYPVYTSPLGDELYFVRKDKKNTYHLYKSDFIKGVWSEPILMPKPFNSSFGVRGFSLNVKGNKALLVKEVEGIFTLFYATKQDNGKWNKPKKLNIPSTKDVLSPVFHFSDTLIYFTSNGLNQGGLGGYDVYGANLSHQGELSNIHALIYPINHTYDTEYFTASGNGISFSSAYHNSLGSKLTELPAISDIQMTAQEMQSLVSNLSINSEIAEVLEVEKTVIQEVEKEVIQEVIEIEEVEVEKEVSVGYVDGKEAKKLDNVVRVETDTIVQYLDAEPVLEEVATIEETPTEESQDSLNIVNTAIANFDLNELNDSLKQNIINKVNVYMNKIKEKQVAEKAKKEEITTTEVKIEGPNTEAENIYFDLNVVNFSKDDQQRLDKLANLALKEPTITIEIVGYTDSQGDFKVNRQIALARADNIYNYLIKKGISEKRMISYGRANLQQASENNTEKGRKLNRRVEILLYH